MVNFTTFGGLVAFVKTVALYAQNTDFEGCRGASMQTCCIFPSTFVCRGFCDDLLLIFGIFMASDPQVTPK